MTDNQAVELLSIEALARIVRNATSPANVRRLAVDEIGRRYEWMTWEVEQNAY